MGKKGIERLCPLGTSSSCHVSALLRRSGSREEVKLPQLLMFYGGNVSGWIFKDVERFNQDTVFPFLKMFYMNRVLKRI